MKYSNMLFALFLVLASSALVSAQQDYFNGCSMAGMMYGGYGGGMMFISWITYLLFIALIITATYWLIQSANKKRK